ncbi:MAG: hypothetical protein Pars2KO_03370 [Parasphingorhabdus sp.]
MTQRYNRHEAVFLEDEGHRINGVRYVSLNPVRARLIRRARGWPWPSAHFFWMVKLSRHAQVKRTINLGLIV